MQEKDSWIVHSYEEYLPPDAAAVYGALPEHVRQGLVKAAQSLYDRGFNHGRSFAGCGTEPVYYVPANHLEIATQATDIA